jgi:signal transduction histidine kinase
MSHLTAYWARRSLPIRAATVATVTTALALVFVIGLIAVAQILDGGRLFYPDQDRDLFDAAARAKIARIDPERYDFTGMGTPDRVTVTVRPRFSREIVAEAKVDDLTESTLSRPEWRRAIDLVSSDQARVELSGSASNARAYTFLAGSAVLTLLLVALATWLATGRTLRSVAAIREQVDMITAEALDRRVPVPPAGDEIARLAETMNRMLDRLARATARQRRFIADASHELRTPVAAVKATTEVALAHDGVDAREVLGEVHRETRRLEALVADLLDLARIADTGAAPRRTAPVDLDDLVLQEVRMVRRLHPALTVDAARVSAARIDGHAPDLTRLLRNLLANAARHAGGRIAVSLENRAGAVRLAVDDDGPGVPPRERDRIFEPFVRVDAGRDRRSGGTGLGLALVRAIVTAHRGTVVATESPWAGARFVVHLQSAHDEPRGTVADALPGSLDVGR